MATSVLAGISTEVTLADLNSKVPTVGQKAPGAALPVVSASDATVIGTAALTVLNTDLLTGTLNGWLDVRAYRSGAIQIIGSAGITAGAVTIEETNDPTLAPNGTGTCFQELSNAASVNAIAVAASTSRVFKIALSAAYVRVRISTAFAGGSVQAVGVFSQASLGLPGASVNAALVASTALAADVGVQLRATATGAASSAKVLAAATTNAKNVKNAGGRVVGWVLFNNAAATRYVKFFAKSTAPVPGTDTPAFVIVLPAGGKSEYTTNPAGLSFLGGIGYAITAGAADNDTTAVAAGDVMGAVFYA